MRFRSQAEWEEKIRRDIDRFEKDFSRAFHESGGQWPPPGFEWREWENMHGGYIARERPAEEE